MSAYERKSDGVTFIDSPTFQTLDSGKAYLYSIIKAEDDCAPDMTVVVEPISQVQCDKTLFKVTASDPRCPDNHIQTVERIFALKIDDVDPVVSIGFELSHPTYYDDDGQYLHIEETNYDFEPIYFHYNVDVSAAMNEPRTCKVCPKILNPSLRKIASKKMSKWKLQY